jgi:tetratricopeptide (TPR) repeat protein
MAATGEEEGGLMFQYKDRSYWRALGLRLFSLGKARLGLMAAVVAATTLAVPAHAQTGGAEGKATLPDGSPCVKCTIILDRQDIKGVYKVKTDKKGHYVYIGLPLGNYKVSLQDPNGRPLPNNGFFVPGHVGLGDPTEINIDLPKEAEAAKQEQQQQLEKNPEMKKQQEEQEKEVKQYAGLKALYDQGVQQSANKQYAEAAATFAQAEAMTQNNPKNQLTLISLEAENYRKAKMYDKAIEAYNKAIAANPNEASYHNNLGTTYADMGKTDLARAEFEKSAQINPAGAAQAYYNEGVIMYNKGDMDNAAAAFKKATEADPKYANAFFMEGRSLLGKLTTDPKTGAVIAPPGTAEALQAYLNLEPNGQFAADAKSMLQTISGTVQTEYKSQKKKKS